MKKLPIVALLVYIVVLNLTYIKIVSPLFKYSGLIYDPDISKFFIAQISTIVLLIIYKIREVPSSILIYLLFINLYIPFVNFYWLANKSTEFTVMIFISFMLLFGLSRLMVPIRVKRLPINLKIEIEQVILFFSLIFVFYFILKFGGIDSRSLDFTKVYEIRDEKEYGILWSYLFNWLSKLFIPFLIVIFYFKSKYSLLCLMILIQIFLYLSTGSKTILFSSFIILISCHLIKKKIFIIGIPLIYSLIAIVSSMVYLITKNINLLAIFPIRQLVIPAQVSYQHYEFFVMREKLYFREGIIGKLFYLKSPYSRPSTTLVGDGNSNANTNFLADAFDNGGILLMLVSILLLVFILVYIDSISNYWSNNKMIVSFFIYTIIILNDGALLTTILTWGLGLLLILILFVKPIQGGSKFGKI